VNQGAQGRIDGLLVGEMLGDVRRQEHEIRSSPIAREIFAADATFQFREIILAAQYITPFPFLSFFLHNVFARVA